MKSLLIGLIAMTSTAIASDIIPTRYIDGVSLSPTNVILKTQGLEWEVAHDCDLELSNQSQVSIKPATKNQNMPTRMSRVDTNSSLVITVDGKKNLCRVKSIQKLG